MELNQHKLVNIIRSINAFNSKINIPNRSDVEKICLENGITLSNFFELVRAFETINKNTLKVILRTHNIDKEKKQYCDSEHSYFFSEADVENIFTNNDDESIADIYSQKQLIAMYVVLYSNKPTSYVSKTKLDIVSAIREHFYSVNRGLAFKKLSTGETICKR